MLKFRTFFVVLLATLFISGPAMAGKEAKILVCHQTGDDTNPVLVLSVSANAANGHIGHGDVVALTEEECFDVLPPPVCSEETPEYCEEE